MKEGIEEVRVEMDSTVVVYLHESQTLKDGEAQIIEKMDWNCRSVEVH